MKVAVAKKSTVVSVDVFKSIYEGNGANTLQSRAVRAEHLQPFVAWANRQGIRKLSVPEWTETLEKFLQLPA